MKIILLGAKGMLGHALADVFRDQLLVGWDREDVDITNGVMLENKFSELLNNLSGSSLGGKDDDIYVVNAAAYTDVDKAEQNKEAVFAVNEQGVKNITSVAKQIGAKVVHYSTDYVFSGNNEVGYREDDEPDGAVNVYGSSKLAGEEALRSSGVEHYLIRTAWLYGDWGKNFVDTILRLSQERDTLEVVNDQFGCPTYSVDLARATRTLIEGFSVGTYHLTNSGVTTWYDFAEEIVKFAGREVELVPVAAQTYVRSAPRPTYSILKNTKGPRLREWQDALRDYLEHK